MEPNKFHMHSWRAFFDLLRLPGPIAFGAYVVASILTLGAAFLCWRARGPLALRYGALLIATVLVDPHLYAYDLLLLVPVYLVLWDWISAEPDGRVAQVRLVYLCYLSPLFVTLADVAGIQLSAPLHGLLLAAILGVLRSEPRP